MKFTFIYFDVDGTLLYKKGLYSTIQLCLQKAGYRVPLEKIRIAHRVLTEIIHFPNQTSKSFYDSFNKEYLYSLGIIPHSELLDSLFSQCKKLEWCAYDDTSVLDNISVSKGIISNWDKTLEEKISKLLPYKFNFVLSSIHVGKQKPSLELYRKAFQKFDMVIEQILYVGNSVKLDIEPVKHLGVQTVLIDRENIYPWYIGERLRSLYELSRYI